MIDRIMFCKDGVIRLAGFKKFALSLELLQKDYVEQTGNKEEYFMMRYLNSPVVIEEGTTLEKLILSLEPWSEMLGRYLDIDLCSYIKAIKKEASNERLKDAWIGIGRNIRLSINYKKEKDDFDFVNGDIKEYFKREVKYTNEIEDNFKMDEELYASYYIKGKEEHYGLSIKKVKNVPVIINPKINIIDCTSKDKPNVMQALNKSAHNIRNIDNLDFIPTIRTYTDMNLTDVLKAIFNYGFAAYSPEVLEYHKKLITQSLNGEERDSDDNWYEEQIEIISKIKERVYPKESRHVNLEHFKEAEIPEERLYNRIIKE